MRQKTDRGAIVSNGIDVGNQLADRYRWRPISELHEDYGDCVLVNVADCGYMEIGSNLNLDFDESKWTHFTRFTPIGQAEYERMREEVEQLHAAASPACPTCHGEAEGCRDPFHEEIGAKS